jgi:hypothetical protein
MRRLTLALAILLAGPGLRLAQAQEPSPEDGTLPAEPENDPAPAGPIAPSPEYTPPPLEPVGEVSAETPQRKGFLGGAAFGLGSVNLDCNGIGCGHYAGVGFSLDAGYAFAPKWAVVGELWFTGGISSADSDFAGQLWTFSANVRYWVLDRFWLQAGLGATGFDQVQSHMSGATASGDGGGFLLGAGAELWRAPNGHLVIDLRAKLGLMSVSDPSLGNRSGDKIGTRQTTAMVTLSWY